MTRLRLTVELLLGVSFGVIFRFLGATGGEASHSFYPHEHLGSILSPSQREVACVRVDDDTIVPTVAYYFISGVLSGTTTYPYDWEDIKWVDFIITNNACPGTLNPDTTPWRLAFFLKHDWDGDVCGDQTWGCELTRGDYVDPLSGHPGMSEFRLSEVRLDSDRINIEDGIHLVNHEVGHSLGLCDGGPGATDPNKYVGCYGQATHTECIDSIMHTHGSCPVAEQRDYPAQSDFTGVQGQVPSASGGGGGSGKAFSLPFGV